MIVFNILNWQVKVFLNDGKKFIGVVSEYRVWKDVALVKIDVPTSVALVAAKWGIDKGVCLGDLVLAVGSTNAWPNSFSKGMIRYLFILFSWSIFKFLMLCYFIVYKLSQTHFQGSEY